MSSNFPFIDFVFSPLGESDVFVEAEGPSGTSINAGEWIKREGGLRALRIDRSLFGVETPRPMSTAPKDGRYIQLWIRSGYSGTPMRCEVARYDAEFRPRQPWVNYAADSVFDGGGTKADLLGWLPLPPLPAQEREKDPAYNLGAFGQWMCGCGYANHPLRKTCRNCSKGHRKD